MTKFETINGTLCRMVEPKPLQLDSPMPCVVRYIQDCSPMGRYVKRKYAMVINTVAIVSQIGTDGRVCPSDKIFVEEVEVLEIIGYPVDEGSRWWALYQMMQGKKVSYKGAIGNVYLALNQDGDVQYYDMDNLAYIGKIRSKLEFVKKDVAKTGWQLYKEPEPEQQHPMPTTEFVDLSDAPAEWICKTRDGGNYPLKYIEVSPTRYAYEDKSGLTVYVMANGRYKKNGTDGRDIIACEPEQPKYKVGDWVEYRLDGDTYYGKICNIRGYVYYLSVTTEEIPKDHARAIMLEGIIRKLAPSQVVITIGCLKGTVEPVLINDIHLWFHDIHLWFHLIGINRKTIATIRIESLDTRTRELVENLLKAQEEK